jgi:hypothetical protein
MDDGDAVGPRYSLLDKNQLTITQTTICIQSVSVYGQTGVLAHGLEYPMEPKNHDPGGSHVISAQFVARVSRCDEQMIRDLASIGECFIKLDWKFPGYNYPKFTTRHFVTLDGGFGDVSFSGGLTWARRILKNAQNMQLTKQPVQKYQYLPMPAPRDSCDGPKLALQPSFRNWLAPNPGYRFPFGPEMRDAPMFVAPEPTDDQTSVCSELTTTTTISDTDTDFQFSCYPPPMEAEHPQTCECCGNYDWMVEQQLQIEILQRQRRNAEAMYARNGDTSGLLAVMASSSQSNWGWDSSGMPRF